MKTTLKKAGAFGALSVAALGILSASAMGFSGGSTLTPDEIATRQTTMFTQRASLIGATVDEVKNAWAQGKSFTALATEKGVTQEQLQTKMKAEHLLQMKSQLATLVSKGVITQAQADQRIAFMQTQSTNKKVGGKHGMRGGMMGFGF
jgi:hypothetical protein